MKALFLCLLLCLPASVFAQTEDSTRSYWIQQLERISGPVIENLSKDSLTIVMPIVHNQEYQYLEAFGRTFCGMSRWLNLSEPTEEDSIRSYYRGKVAKCFSNGFNPQARDYFNFKTGKQPLVDAAFLAQGLLRCPLVWSQLDESTKQHVLKEFMDLRRVKPYDNNWMLFASTIEAFILDKTGSCDECRLWEGINAFVYGFYVGDGIYSDGHYYDNNYYNSFVIHPMLMDVLLSLRDSGIKEAEDYLRLESKRYHRYAAWLERQIAPDGSLPVYGRSIVYRIGILHALAEFVCITNDATARGGEIRSAMTKVLTKQLDDMDFDNQGFLTIGFKGLQPDLAEPYISTGSGYLCTTFFLPLGLSQSHPFWKDEQQDWTSLRIQVGSTDVSIDESYREETSCPSFLKRLYYQYKYLASPEKRVARILLFAIFVLSVGGYVLCLMIVLHYRKKRGKR